MPTRIRRPRRGVMLGVAGAAALIAAITVFARVAGFGRIVVFSRTVGQTCLGDTYQTVNTVPNIVFEIVAGGALASLVVPLLAGATAAGDRDQTRQISSALLTWTLLVLTPMAVLVAVFAEPIATGLLGAKNCQGAIDVAVPMLRVFAPQVVLYGVGIVLTGILQAHRRFGGAALAPLLSSVVVITAYLWFAVRTPAGVDVGTVSLEGELILSVGTTLGVAVLALSLLVPLRQVGLRLHPALRFPTGVAARAGRLAAAGVVALVAQQIAVTVALVLGNGAGVPAGSVTVLLYAQTIYLLPWAVLAVPIATSVFQRLADRYAARDEVSFARVTAAAIRAVSLTALLAGALLVAAAEPVARLLVESAPGAPSVQPLAEGIAAFAPGLVGYGLFALLARALIARDAARAAAVACVTGWLAVVVADLVLATALPEEQRVLALAAGSSVGMTVLGLALLTAVRRGAGAPALAGVPRSVLLSLLCAVVAAAAGRGVAELVAPPGLLGILASGALVGGCVVAVFGVMMVLVARTELRAALSYARRGRPAGGPDREEQG